MAVSRPLANRELLTAQDVAYRLNVSVRTVWRWRAEGKLPPPIRYSQRLIRWRASDIETYVRLLSPSPVAG